MEITYNMTNVQYGYLAKILINTIFHFYFALG